MLPYTPGQLRQWEGRFARLGQKRPVVIYYVIAEDTVDEHIASILIDKLPAVQRIVQDAELAEAGDILAGIDTNETDQEFTDSILAQLDF
jgi:SNF2 family DNA or RNA helicase